MTAITASMKRARFGIDAPTVVRNLLAFGIVTGLLACFSLMIERPLFFWFIFLNLFFTSLSFFVTTLGMIYSSRLFKPKHLAKLTSELNLQGDEEILDMGCGRGMFLCEAAKKITTGRVYGIDLWISQDQSNNCEAATWDNVEALGVRDRIDLETADMCDIPYADEKFDVIISSLAIHNIPTYEGRKQALKELLRTLKPGGRFVISDIFHSKQYIQFFTEEKGVEFTASKPIYWTCPPLTVIRGIKLKETGSQK